MRTIARERSAACRHSTTAPTCRSLPKSGDRPERPHSGVKKSQSSKQWLRRHVSDPYVQRSKREGYRSRSAYKLAEIDARDRLLRPGIVVVDLGAAPGGWSQVAAQKVGAQGLVVAIDLLAMEPVAGVRFVQGDFATGAGLNAIEAALAGRKADLV